MGKLVSSRVIGTNPYCTPVVFIETQHRLVAHTIGVARRYITIGAHKYLFDTKQTSPYRTRPHVIVAVSIETEDRTERKRIDIARDIAYVGKRMAFDIQDTDATPIGSQPQLVVILLDIENHIVGQSRVSNIVVLPSTPIKRVTIQPLSIRRNP